MAISKSTPYVRYKKDFTSSLHLGTIHIESEYLDRTQKTTIESIHGMTWHNKVVNENKELNLLSDTQLELTELEKQYWNTGEKRVSVDEIHTLEEVEPNEDGTYTYTVNSMEGEYIEIYDGINNITSVSDGLDGQFEIVYDTTEEDINGNIALDQVAPQYEITDSGVGTVTSAKSTGLTLVNHITEPSKEEVVAIGEYEGQYFTIENTVQGDIKSAILKGNTLVNNIKRITTTSNYTTIHNNGIGFTIDTNGETISRHSFTLSCTNKITLGAKYTVIVDVAENTMTRESDGQQVFKIVLNNYNQMNSGYVQINVGETGLRVFEVIASSVVTNNNPYMETPSDINGRLIVNGISIIEGHNHNLTGFIEGMQSIKMPILTTTGKNLWNKSEAFFSTIHSTRTSVEIKSYMRENAINWLICKDEYWEGNYSYENGEINVSPESPYKGVRIYVGNLKPNTDYSISYDVTTSLGSASLKQSTSDTGGFVEFLIENNTKTSFTISNIQIEEGSATPYEPYKSNTLTVNEEVELRGVGDVRDELNLSTGELTQRIGEAVYTEKESWYHYSNNDFDNSSLFSCTSLKIGDVSDSSMKTNFISDRFTTSNVIYVQNIIGSYLQNGSLFIRVKKEWLTTPDVYGLQSYLQQNPITIQYPLETESIKTVDLTVQNQDGNTIPHIQTQQGATHVSTSSDGLTPVVEMSSSYDTIIKPNTTYTIKLDRPIVSDTMYLQVDLGGTMMMLDADVNAFTIKTPSTLSHSQLRLNGTGNTVKEIIVLEGNRVNDKIEYFEGIENVENPILIVSNCPYVFGKGGRI